MKIVTALKICFNAFIKNEKYARFFLAERLSNLIYPTYKFSDFGRIFLEDEQFLTEYKSFFPGQINWHSLDRKFALSQLLRGIKHIPGDTAECGAFEGASSFFMCKEIKNTSKNHYVFDSFEGLSCPDTVDGSFWSQGDFAVSDSVISKNLSCFNNVKFFKGWIPQCFPNSIGNFCFVHIDVDLYQPTLDSLVYFYPKVNSGGIILCDDYGFEWCVGAKKAFDEFFSDKPEEVVHLPTGQALVIKRTA
ncbi:Macrocin-O-methyltransferase [Burkholderiaceae bacterium]